MTLSNTLFNIISNKLKLKVSLLNEERSLVKNLKNRINLLKKNKENNYRYLSRNKTYPYLSADQNLIVMYIINISFLKANTTIHISDVKGKIKLFYSAGSVDLTGKQKRKRRIAVSRLISLLLRKLPFLNTQPIALHLINVNTYRSFIIDKLKKRLYLRVIKSFNQASYNGCRKRKLRRKKYTKTIK